MNNVKYIFLCVCACRVVRWGNIKLHWSSFNVNQGCINGEIPMSINYKTQSIVPTFLCYWQYQFKAASSKNESLKRHLHSSKDDILLSNC